LAEGKPSLQRKAAGGEAFDGLTGVAAPTPLKISGDGGGFVAAVSCVLKMDLPILFR
jgi:hypothetical protein